MPRSKLITLKFTCPCLPLVTLEIKKIFVHLCYEGVCDEGIDPIDFCDLYLISNVISKKRANRFHSHLISRSLSFISCTKALIQDAQTLVDFCDTLSCEMFAAGDKTRQCQILV